MLDRLEGVRGDGELVAGIVGVESAGDVVKIASGEGDRADIPP